MLCLLLISLVVLAITASAAVVKTDYPVPAPTFAAKDFTKWQERTVMKSRRADIHIDFTADDGSADYVHLYRLDMVGNAYERGYAQGNLLSKEIMEFLTVKMGQYYRDAILDLDITQYPEPLQDILRVVQKTGAIGAPDAFKRAFAWVWEKEKMYFPAYVFEEIDGMAKGLCDAVHPAPCNVTQWTQEIQEFNMMPELIRMACTAYGAWGAATPSGKGLVQTRALDFGGGPFSNYTVIGTHRDTSDPNFNSFVSITFPGMVGAITGVSEKGVGISEKVWMTYDEKDLQPGSFQGEADIFVLRDILQNSKNKAEAEAYLQAINRTWAIWIGVGDYETMSFDLVGYRQTDVGVYNDVTMPSMTGQPYIQNIAYVDKHPQPSGEGPTGTLPQALQDFWGNMTLENSKTILKYHRTGDVHIATYDFEHQEMYVAIGRVDGDGKYGPDDEMWNACNRPYVQFNLKDLWSGL